MRLTVPEEPAGKLTQLRHGRGEGRAVIYTSWREIVQRFQRVTVPVCVHICDG